MPMSSGANGWPTAYYNLRPPKSPQQKVVVVDRPVKAAAPQPPPPPKQREQIIVVDQHHPPPPYSPPRRTRRTPPPRTPTPDRYRRRRDYSPEDDGCCGGSRHSGGRGGRGWDGQGGRGRGRGGCLDDSMYTTGMAGAGAGCCAGGMFGSRAARYPYDKDNEYMMPGQGRRRCWACVLGLLIGLLLLALLLGLLLGLKPALERDAAEERVQAQMVGGYYRDGIYYYPITDPPDVYYMVLGPGYPCNPFNNNSDVMGATVGYEMVTVPANDTLNTTESSFTVQVTELDPTTVPNCEDITTSIVLNTNITAASTPSTLQVVMVTESAAHNANQPDIVLLILLAVVGHMALAMDIGKYFVFFNILKDM